MVQFRVRDTTMVASVADPGCFISDPGPEFFLFRIPAPGSKRFPDPGSGSALKTLSISTCF
jgi:hypothetical protein